MARTAPLDLYVEEIGMKARVRTRNLLKDTWDGLPTKGKAPLGHRKIWDKMTKGWGCTEMSSSIDYSWVEWDELMYEDVDFRIYTDGASNELGAGYAFIAYEKGRETPVT